MSQDILLTVMNSMSLIGESVNMESKRNESCDKCFNLEAELLKSQNAHNDLLKSYSQLEKHFISLELSIQLNQEIFQKDKSCNNQNALEILEFFENKDLKAQLQDKDTTIYTCPSAIKLSSKKVAVTPKNNVKKVRFAEPLTSSSNIKQVESSTTPDSNTHVLSPTRLKCFTSNCGSKPTGNKKNDRISRTPSRNMKNKVEAQPRKDNKKNLVVEPIRYVDVKHSLLKANSKLNCATCCPDCSLVSGLQMFKTYDKEPLSALELCRTFTIVGKSCLLTRITSANVVPPKKTTSNSVETQKLELKVYRRKPKNVKNIGSSKKAKIVESKNANHSEPNHTWGSNATDIPSSSSLVMTGCPDCSLVSGLRMFKTYDKEPLSAHELSKDGLARGIPRLKFQKDHLCSACALGKSKKSSHQPKAKDTNQEKLYLLHMDLCGPMRVAITNRKSSIIFMGRSNQNSLLHLKPFINPPSIQQNSILQDKKPDLSFFHDFGALCYPTNDNDDMGKLDAKANIGIFIGYAPSKKAFKIYNKRTRKIIETIHVTFDELTAMASEQFSSGPGLHSMTPVTSSSRLVPNPIPQQPFAVTPVQDAIAPRAVVLADSPVSTSID
ncbi:retrovirus-related pol polyprotein from transposon TNT 1-94 [Tanacetum coccineum]